MDSTEFIKSLDKTIVDALIEIVVNEQKTERLMRKGKADDKFINDLCSIVDKHSSYWTGGLK